MSLRISVVCLGFLAASLSAQSPARRSSKLQREPDRQTSVARWNNLGVAYMNQQQIEQAITAFEKAHAADPSALVPELNRAIALQNQQHMEPALGILQKLAQRDPRNPRVWYNLGLLYRNLGQMESAMDAFQKVATLAPNDPEAEYFIGDLYTQLRQYEKSIPAYQLALKANPFHVSSEFGLARALQRTGNSDEARKHMLRFQQLTKEKLGSPVSQVYGEQGKYSLAQDIAAPSAVLAPISVKFVPAGGEAGLPTGVNTSGTPTDKEATAFLGSGVCVFDFDGDGRLDLFFANIGGKGPTLYRNLGGGRYEDITRGAGLGSKTAGIGCAAGDYDNDGSPDLAVGFPGHIVLYHNEGGKFQDVTSKAGIAVTGTPVGITFVDYDHDGDLDLYVTRFSPFGVHNKQIEVPSLASGGNLLWRNNGDGTFTEVGESRGLAGKSPSLGVIASDIDNDRAVDLVVTQWQSPASVFVNPREGAFLNSQPWASTLPGSTVGASSGDFNKDGWMDLVFTHLQSPGLTVWRNVEGHRFEAVAMPKTDWTRAWGVATLDYDNDGWVDIAAIGESENGSELRLFRNRGGEGFEDVTQAVGLDKIKLHEPRALVAFDYDGDGAADLLLTQADGSVILLRNAGGTQNNSLRLSLKGLADNKSALGTKVEIFAGQEHQKWEIAGSSGYLSQGPPEVLAGLGKQKQVDVVRMLWPTGVVQDEMQIAVGKPQNIHEIDRRGSSCPVLFAWNGESYELVTDVIGPAVIGHWTGPGERDIADPDEYVKVEGSRIKPHGGLLSFRFAEPMEEVNYLDEVRLLAIDHKIGTGVFPNERFISNPPFPEFKVITSRGARLPLGAWDDSGRDVLPALRNRDHKYAAGFPKLKFAGFAQTHTLELDLGEWDASHPLRLLMYGFTDYFSANSMYAAYQAGVRVMPPYVEALDEKGIWVRVMEDMGFPAGLPRTMVADLTGHLPPHTRRIRIGTNLQIYWDQILIDNSAEDPSVRVSEVPLSTAGLHFHGYPKSEERYFPGDLNYLYDQVSLTGPYARHSGEYTRYGDVLPLLTKVDDQFVVFGSGEEVKLDFDPGHLPALPRGWERDYFFYANGFVKDMDFYEADALTVGPLPFHAMRGYPYDAKQRFPDDDRSLEYQTQYNTRFQSGRGIRMYKFSYPTAK